MAADRAPDPAGLLDTRYAPHADWRAVVPPEALAAFDPGPRYWRSPAEIRAGRSADDPPLAGLRVALDPGHWGGEWARLSDREFVVGDGLPVREGELVLVVARAAARRLEALGAEVTLVRGSDRPLVERPADAASRDWVVADLEARAHRVNEVIRPDLLISLHIDATAWRGEPVDAGRQHYLPEHLARRNHLHVLVFGALGADEMGRPGQLNATLDKLLNGSGEAERLAGQAMAEAFVEATGLPPYRYRGDNAVALGAGGYLWARNLVILRLSRCPTVLLEPHVANSIAGHRRIQAALRARAAGDTPPPDDILVEYENALVAGVRDWFESGAD